MDRRGFIVSALATASVGGALWADLGQPTHLAAAREPTGIYALFGIGADCADRFRVALPGRGHAAAAHPVLAEAVAFARRPGQFAMVIDCASGAVMHRLEPPQGRHFYGHGAYVAGGEILVTTENIIENGQGVLGLWARSEGYRRIGELPSGGIGPHEVLALGDGVLAVANGGIRTHPDHARDKLNLDSMQPNLAYVDLDHGVVERVEIANEFRKNSIRHLASQGDIVGFAMQWQGAAEDAVPLLGIHRRGQAARLAEAPLAEQIAMQGYAGSIAMQEGQILVTSPRGNRAHLFDLEGGFLKSVRRRDVCGAAPDASGRGFVLTDGMGGVLEYNQELKPLRRAERAWDNHLIRLAAPTGI